MEEKPRIPTATMIQALQETNGLVSLAAKRLGCTPQNIYQRAKSTKSIQDAITQSRDELIDLAELSLRRAIVAGEGWAVAMTLKTIGKHRGYVERQEITGAEGGPVVITWDDTDQG